MSNKIIITGATGFLGSNLLHLLVARGFNVVIFKRIQSDLRRINTILDKIEIFNLEEISINECVKTINPDIIIHCATDYGRKNIDPSAIIEANLILPLKLLEAAQKNGIRCFINTDTFLDKGINHYSLSKKQFKDWLFTFSTNTICINIVLEHFYGPFDDKTKFVSFIIEKFLINSPEIDLTLGEQKRDFIYIDDVVSAFLCIIDNVDKKSNGFYEYEIGTTNQIKIKELIEAIRTLTQNSQTKTNFGVIPYRKNEIMESKVNITEITALGWTPNVDIYTGLKQTIDAEINLKIVK